MQRLAIGQRQRHPIVQRLAKCVHHATEQTIAHRYIQCVATGTDQAPWRDARHRAVWHKQHVLPAEADDLRAGGRNAFATDDLAHLAKPGVGALGLDDQPVERHDAPMPLVHFRGMHRAAQSFPQTHVCAFVRCRTSPAKKACLICSRRTSRPVS